MTATADSAEATKEGEKAENPKPPSEDKGKEAEKTDLPKEPEKIEKSKDAEFEIPSWAGKPPTGFHLDVLKGDKLIQKLMIDEKRCYYFGRNPQMCDFAIDHSSCSRRHAALLYHKHLARCFLVDLGSTHGTFIGKVRLEAEKPQYVMTDQTFHFGASTRNYVLRERPSGSKVFNKKETESTKSSASIAKLLGLPEGEEELDNLTEYNTALNRRVSSMGIPETDLSAFRKRKGGSVHFDDEEHIINPEDVDPSIGRFRNLVHTAIIPNKKLRLDSELEGLMGGLGDEKDDVLGLKSVSSSSAKSANLPMNKLTGFGPISAKLSMSLPNSAPDIHPSLYGPTMNPQLAEQNPGSGKEEGPKKKVYAKEAWPGKKPTASHLLV